MLLIYCSLFKDNRFLGADNMKEHPKYLLVDSQILPEVYLKVILAKKLLAQGKAKSASEAAKSAGFISTKFLFTNTIPGLVTVL